MLQADKETTEKVVICERKDFAAVLLSPFGIFMLILAPFTLGFTVLLTIVMHFAVMPGRLWIQDGRLFSDKTLPADGVKLSDIRPELLSDGLARAIRLYFQNQSGRESYLALNQMYFGRQAIDRVVEAVSGGADS